MSIKRQVSSNMSSASLFARPAVLLASLLLACSPDRDHQSRYGFTSAHDSIRAHSGSEYLDYYKGAEGLSGKPLRTYLHDKIKVALRLPYARVILELEYTDADPDAPDKIVMIYSGRSLPADSAGADPYQTWNREHIWAKSHGFPRVNMSAHTDLHHIRPCEISLNRLRGDSMFAELSLAGGEPVVEAPGARVDTQRSVFTPPTSVRGDIARMLFYMDIRYEGDDPREPNLKIVDTLPNDLEHGVDSNGTGYHGYLRTLIKWHQDDPVDDFERQRNERVFERQKNRNPFIDHPEYVTMMNWST